MRVAVCGKPTFLLKYGSEKKVDLGRGREEWRYKRGVGIGKES
jgi:hypothetical protein